MPTDHTSTVSTSEEIIIRSSDEKDFQLSKNDLAHLTEAFPGGSMAVADAETVQLEEPAHILELLFQFVQRQPPPILEGIKFSELLELAEAAEKYVVYSAISICQIKLREFKPEHTKEVLAFALKHNYTDLFSELTPLLIDWPLIELAQILPPHLYYPWSIYSSHWRSALFEASKSGLRQGCHALSGYHFIMHNITKPSDLLRVGAIFKQWKDANPTRRESDVPYNNWEREITVIVAAIPKFSLDLYKVRVA